MNRRTAHRDSSSPSNLTAHPQPERFASVTPVAVKTLVDSERDGHSVSGMVDAVLEIGRQRSVLLAQLRVALESGAEREALTLARRLCGLP